MARKRYSYISLPEVTGTGNEQTRNSVFERPTVYCSLLGWNTQIRSSHSHLGNDMLLCRLYASHTHAALQTIRITYTRCTADYTHHIYTLQCRLYASHIHAALQTIRITYTRCTADYTHASTFTHHSCCS